MSNQSSMESIPADGAVETEKGSAWNPGEGPSLRWLISPIEKQSFFKEYWEIRPLVIHRGQPDYFSSLISLDEVDRALTTLDRRYPNTILKNAARDIARRDYTVDGEVLDVAKVYQHFADGSTITLAFLDNVVPSLTRFCRALECELSFPLQTNIYLTPPGAQGARPHYDTHDVFVLQVAGSKQWTVYGTPYQLPLASQDFDPEVHKKGAVTLEFDLRAGDIIYVPRGVVHEARSTDEVSLHITAGILRYTWADLLLEYVAGACLNDPAFRRSLPPGFARPGFDKAQAKQALHALLGQVPLKADFDAALNRFLDALVRSCPPLLEGQMAQIAALDALTADSLAGARPGVVYYLQETDDSVVIHLCGRKITFPSFAADALRYALRHPEFLVRDLPGGLDDAGKLTLVRRLIREGLLMALHR
ncbi:MAG TPA: cupin domain-containing protein [Terriglobia bacterium]|nr:cupin domain-containing protein [Terriglobia bacterium]